MSMHINLSPEMEGYVKAKVSSGFYGNATEVIRDALRRMRTDEERRAAFRSAVAVGDAELDRGESVEYNRDTLDAITQGALRSLHSEEPLDPDVIP